MNSMAGHLLVAVPELPDTNFFRTVVLMFQHDEQGAAGLILNRPSHVRLAEVWSQFSESACSSQQFLHIGGPVSGPLLIVHTCLEAGESAIFPGVYLSAEKKNIEQVCLQTEHPFKAFSGYSGWGPGQLEQEMKVGGWLSTAAEMDHVFADGDELWKSVCEAIGQQILLPQVRRKFTNDPSLN
jgi:putative transcriptional regulator